MSITVLGNIRQKLIWFCKIDKNLSHTQVFRKNKMTDLPHRQI
jgi:hypothetical protein